MSTVATAAAWVLLIVTPVHSGNGYAKFTVTTQEFSTVESCVKASERVLTLAHKVADADRGGVMHASIAIAMECVPK